MRKETRSVVCSKYSSIDGFKEDSTKYSSKFLQLSWLIDKWFALYIINIIQSTYLIFFTQILKQLIIKSYYFLKIEKIKIVFFILF